MRITTAGYVFIIFGAALIIAAYRFGYPGLLPVGILFIVLVGLSALAAYVTGAQIRVTLTADAPAVSGTPIAHIGTEITVLARATNRMRVPTLPFTLTLHTRPGLGESQQAEVSVLPPGRTAAVEAVFIPTFRCLTGIAKVTATINGPFGLAASMRPLSVSLPIAAAPAEVPVGIPQSLSAHLSRVTSDRVSRGVGTRDYFTREYVPGDDLRYIHWKTTARMGELAVRQEAEEDHATAIVVLDGAGSSDPRFESLAAAAAAAVRAYHLAGYEIKLHYGSRELLMPEGSLTLPDAEYEAAIADAAPIPPGLRIPRDVETVVLCMDPASVSFSIPPRSRVWCAKDVPAPRTPAEPPIPATWSLQARRV